MSQSSVPFLPFVRPEIDEETIQGVAEVLRSGWITTGPQNQAFEAALSEFCGGRPVRTFNSGTATLEIGLRIAGVGEGDEVITTPASWVSTSNVIYETGATPVFADEAGVVMTSSPSPTSIRRPATSIWICSRKPSRRAPRRSSRFICRACRSTWTGSTKSPAPTSCA
jgi:hypothetical protein